MLLHTEKVPLMSYFNWPNEIWKNRLDSGKTKGALIIDLSQVFNCIRHDLIIDKFKVYGFDGNALTTYLSLFKNDINKM